MKKFGFMKGANKPKAGDGYSTEETVLDLLDQYASYIAAAGHKAFRAPRDKALDIIRGMSQEKKTQTIDRLRGDLSIIREAMSAGESLSDSRRLLWRFLKRNTLTPCSDLFNEIEDDDVVELYGADGIHLWQNMVFFDWISITLDRIYCQTWYECCSRPAHLQAELMVMFAQVMKGEIAATFAPNHPWYWIEEIDTEMLYKLNFKIKAISPVFQNGHVAGLIAINTCKDLIPQRA